ncbi:MAG: PAS domain-containing protein [Bacteriovoracaceae bacterium]|nr:PAS domain-containing protein [Bacteriovoracaceae bacterium]
MKLDQMDMERFFKESLDIFVMAGIDGYFKQVNQAFCNLVGLNESDALAKKILDYIHPEDINASIDIIQKLQSGEDTVNFVNRYLNKQNEWSSISWTAHYDADLCLMFAVGREITDLLIKDSLLKELQRIATIGSWEFNVVRNELRWSEGVYDLHAIPRDIPIRVDEAINYYPDHEKARISKCVSDCIEHGISFDEEFEFVNAQGKHLWVRSMGQPRFENNTIVGIFGIFQDISEKKNLQIATYRQNAELISFHQGLNQFAIVVKTDPQGKITYVNENFCRISQYSKEELLGKDHRILNSGSHPKEFFTELWGAIKSGKSWRGEICNRAKDGSTYWVDTTIAPVFLEGKITEYVAFRFVVTQEKKQEIMKHTISEIRKHYIESHGNRKKFFELVLSSVLSITESGYGFIGGIYLDPEGKPFLRSFAITDISWNEEVKKFFLENTDKGLEFRNLNTLFGEVIKTGNPLLVNHPDNHPKSGGLPAGHPLLHNFLGLPCYNSGQFIAMIGVANTRAGYHQEMIEYMKPLLEVVGEMINSFNLEEKLEEQKRISLHSAKLASIGQMAAGVGHEINNPLALVKGYLSMLEGEIKASNFKKDNVNYFDNINKAITRIENIVKGLRVFSRLDSEQLSSFSFSDLVKETYDLLFEIYEKSGVRIQLNFRIKNKIIIYGNRGRLQQAIINLIANAKDALEGRVNSQIEIILDSVDGQCLFTVKDNGCGIAEENLNKILEPFFTTKEVNKGTGIGLALVNSIIKEHDGQLEIKSQINVGSEFKIILPIQNMNEAEVREVLSQTQETKTKEASKYNVLVVDDEEGLREILSYIVETLGHKAISAENGKKALEKLNSQTVDLIISDMKMPVLDGIGLLREVKSKIPKPPKFVFISGGVDMEESELNHLISECQGIISKPFTKESVSKAISVAFELDKR